MLLRRLNFMNWPISTKLATIFLLAVLLPALLIIVPFSVQRRSTSLREQNEVRLETLGPWEVARTELALQSLSATLERLAADPTDYTELERFFYLGRWSSLSEDTRQELQTFITQKINEYMRSAPSLSRVRLYGNGGQLLADAMRNEGLINISYEEAAAAPTPANLLIEGGTIGLRTTTTDIYQDSQGSPSLDVIYTLRPPWDPTGAASIVGQIIFTQDLELAASDPSLPDLYTLIQEFPQSEQETHVFLLSTDGRLITPAGDARLFDDISDSEGFRLAQGGQSGVSSYHSPLLRTEVLGYYSAVTFPDGPRIMFLAETPLSEINRESVEEGFFALLWAGLGSLALGLLSIALGTLIIARPLTRMTDAARQITAGRFDVHLPRLARADEIGVLNNVFSDMSDQLLAAFQELESRVTERTRNLEAMLEVGRVLTSIRDLDILLEDIVNLIRDQFDKVYHAQVFLIDPRTNRANLRASTGAPGQMLLQRGHYLEVGSQSVIGSVTSSGHAVVALDTSRNPIHQRNEFLPDTRAEMALPLRVGGQIIGALDLQSTQPDAFTEPDVDLFQGMADQISIAIHNTRLFRESSERLFEIERLNRSLTETAWREVVQRQTPQALSAAAGPISEAQPDGWTELQLKAMQTRQIAERVEGENVTFAVPVLLREQVMGAVEWQMPQARYTPDARQTALELSARLALTAENIRLFEQSLQATQRELLVNQISSKLTGSTDINQILQIAVRELGLALRTSQTVIRLAPPAQASGDEADPGEDRISWPR